ncbi:FAD-dependent oxidoreductase [Streptoalloteichus hindustanus]|uniref:2-polyprenyl-6-methoxyphenol hydroxylase n=1 Tax=Streptoalloteichus hindustanus TaxID=2017 RepID=A0A1M5D613_STRHI|nr:FAD-dependent monooxygenase [Streptoalloteichus hindustanus]SHF62513.1 2-polyprenyl-6-methoxyphenol hydroxylase [Streptoalloteichus hindustanus]
MRVIIIGAGLGGLALARFLRRADIDVSVHERDEALEQRPQGARIHLDERGIGALHACLTASESEFLDATLGQPDEHVTVLDQTDLAIVKRRKSTGREGHPDAIRPGASASRRIVRRLLAHGVRDTIRFGSTLTDYTEHTAGVTVRFADGTVDEADLLVGADGIGSAVRRLRLPDATVNDSGLRLLQAKTPITPELVATGVLDRIGGSFTLTAIGDVQVIMGAVRFGEQPATAAERLVPGFDPGDRQDYVMWGLLLRRRQLGDLGRDFTRRSPASLSAHLRNVTATAHPVFRLLLDQAFPDQFHGLAMGTSREIPAWTPSRVTLLGDAIHAMLPTRASGANSALQDARRLADAILSTHTGAQTWEHAIGDYENLLRRDGFQAVRASLNGVHELDEHLTTATASAVS